MSGFGHSIAVSKRVTPPSALPNFSWNIATPLSGVPASAMASQADASAADSFQNIFANTAAQSQFAATNSAWSDSSSAASNLASSWTTQPTAMQTPSNEAASGPEYLSNQPTSESTNEAASQPVPSSDTSGSAQTRNQSAAGISPAIAKQSATKVDKKLEQPSQRLHTDQSGGSAGLPASAGAVPAHAAAANHATAQSATPERSADIQQTGPASGVTEKTGSLAGAMPGASNTLPGAAFAMHITPAGKHTDATPKTGSATSLAQGPIQAQASAATASPSDNSVPDPGAQAGGISDPAGLLVSATLAASSGSAHSRQVSAIGASLDAADTTPWSAPTSSPALLNDQAKSAEPLTAAAPVAEVDVEDPTGSAQPVRSLQLQLGGTGDQRVDLRMVEHAGGLSVSVRASDSNLTRGLQDNLPELSSRLAAEHYQTQTWLPAAGQTSAGGHSSGSSEQSPDQRGGGQSSQGGSSSGDQGNSRQGREQAQTPAWWRQMATPGGATDSVTSSVLSSAPNLAASPVTKQ